MIIIVFLALILSGCIQDPWAQDQARFNSLTYEQQQRELDRRAYLQGALGPALIQGMNQNLSNMQQPLQPIRPAYPVYPSNQYPYGCMSNGQYTSCY